MRAEFERRAASRAIRARSPRRRDRRRAVRVREPRAPRAGSTSAPRCAARTASSSAASGAWKRSRAPNSGRSRRWRSRSRMRTGIAPRPKNARVPPPCSAGEGWGGVTLRSAPASLRQLLIETTPPQTLPCGAGEGAQRVKGRASLQPLQVLIEPALQRLQRALRILLPHLHPRQPEVDVVARTVASCVRDSTERR